MLAGVLPTPAVALLALDLGAVISASHNPPEYNGVKLFDATGRSSPTRRRRRSRRCSTRRRPTSGGRDRPRRGRGRQLRRARRSSASARDLTGLRIAVDCANGAYSGIAPRRSSSSAPRSTTIGAEPDGDEHQRRLRRDRPARCCSATVASGGLDLGVAFDGDGDRMLAVDEDGDAVDGDQILAVLALHLGRRHSSPSRDDEPRLPPADGRARHPRRHDRRRRPLRARGAAPRGRPCSAASSRAT